MKSWTERLKSGADALRDLAAVLSTPLLHAYAIGILLILWRGGWAPGTAEQRINFIGGGFLAAHILLAFGLFWLRRERVEKASISAGGLNASIETDDPEDDPPG